MSDLSLYLGIDASPRNTGLALVDKAGKLWSWSLIQCLHDERRGRDGYWRIFTESMGDERREYPIEPGWQLLVYTEAIKNYLTLFKPQIQRAVFEDHSLGEAGRSSVVFQMGEFMGILKYVLMRLGIPFVALTPTSIRANALDNGKMKKLEAIQLIQTRFNTDIPWDTMGNRSEHVADSIPAAICAGLNIRPNKLTEWS